MLISLYLSPQFSLFYHGLHIITRSQYCAFMLSCVERKTGFISYELAVT
jgi:hypothetical protein